ncbi:MFS transporter [Terracidiphilus gabretensis]|uniref:MFS transporter n=1 Tax=Terracidiphilus gabretensis TaxID=1577687 RepID=UPI00071B7917|nr:MFS transporter [Terracidiphilus gabretensis]
MPTAVESTLARYNRFLLIVAGLGGLLYGIDVGIIGGALPYLEATSGLNRGQISIIVAAVLLGSVFSTLFAGLLADWLGRKPLMLLSGLAFSASVPIIALSHGFAALFAGRLLQGVSGGLVGVVVPLYLAECLGAKSRGKGTGIFQWLLTFGIFIAALMSIFLSYHVAEIAKTASPDLLHHTKDLAWRSIFWMSLPPGLLFVVTAFFISESPRWLFSRGRTDAARTALLRSRTPEQATTELGEMAQIAAEGKSLSGAAHKGSLFSRRYVIPFILACVILACNTATGINSVIGYNVDILIQSGLSDVMAHWGYVLFTFCNFLMTVVGLQLVDKKGRRFLLITGTSGIILSMVAVGTLFLRSEGSRYDARDAIQSLVTADNKISINFNDAALKQLGAPAATTGPQSLAIIYSYGDFNSSTKPVLLDDAEPASIDRASSIPETSVAAFFQNPFADLKAAQTAPLRILHAYITPVPSATNGWLVAICLYLFVGFYALGPGVCVWLALSELMPTRIRSNGMSVALVLNQTVSTTLAAIFLPVVGKYGYSTMFYLFAGFTVIYFLTAAFFMPETKGKTLEEIEKFFEGK